MTERVLNWDGCLNVRDLGGHPTEGGGVTRFGAVVRADSVRRLTDSGWQALVDHGIRTIVDLRRHDELDRDPPLDVPVDVVHVPLSTMDEEVGFREIWQRPDEGDHAPIRETYELMVERLAPNFARAVETVGDAPAGGVVVHCFAGKDRTGLVCAMLLRLAGVPIDDIAHDYGLSGENIRPLLEPWISEAADESERAARLRVGMSPPQVMTSVLESIEEHTDGVRGYLLGAGAAPDSLERARTRLVG